MVRSITFMLGAIAILWFGFAFGRILARTAPEAFFTHQKPETCKARGLWTPANGEK